MHALYARNNTKEYKMKKYVLFLGNIAYVNLKQVYNGQGKINSFDFEISNLKFKNLIC